MTVSSPTVAAVHPPGVQGDVVDQRLEARAGMRGSTTPPPARPVRRRRRGIRPHPSIRSTSRRRPVAEHRRRRPTAAGSRSAGARSRAPASSRRRRRPARRRGSPARVWCTVAERGGPRIAPDRLLAGSRRCREWDGSAPDQRTFAGMSRPEIQVHRGRQSVRHERDRAGLPAQLLLRRALRPGQRLVRPAAGRATRTCSRWRAGTTTIRTATPRSSPGCCRAACSTPTRTVTAAWSTRGWRSG